MRFAVLTLGAIGLTAAQSGHWEGSIQTPDREMNVSVDLAKNDKGEWKGALAIPAQNAKGIPLEPIAVEGAKVRFSIKGAPAHQAFEGSMSEDGKTMSGNFSSDMGSAPSKLTRTGEAKFEPVPKSTPLAKDLEGDWEGALDIKGNVLHLKLKLANGPEGGTGSVISVDQGGTEIQISSLTQKESNLKIEFMTINGAFTGDVSADRKQIAGTWTQGPGTLPLTFKRPAK